MEKNSSPPPPPPALASNKVVLTGDEKTAISKEDLLVKFEELENHVTRIEENGVDGKTVDEKLKLQQQESTRRENVLVMRLATKEQEMQELLTQIQELKRAQTPATTQLQTMLIDPAVNLLFEKMKTELTETKERLEQAQNDLSAWKFTPDSVTGKKLMGKCRMLIQENQDLGKQLSQGRIAQLEAELALQKKYSEELKGSQDEMNEFVIQLDEEVEGMQATICTLQQQLKEAKQNAHELDQANSKLKELLRTSECTSNGNELHTLSNHHSPDHTQTDHLDHELTPHTDEAMDVDASKQDLQSATHVNRTIEGEQDLDTHPALNQVTVIRGTDDNKRDLDSIAGQYLSPKGLTKTSFSITDLLSTNSIKKDPSVPMEVAPDVKTEENGGENGLLNGEIDDAAI